MWCARYRRLLVPYIECELDERDRAKLEAHLSRCPSCAREAELIKSVSGALRASETPAMEPAPDLWAKVSARIEREAPAIAPRPWLRVGQAASAVAAAVLVAAVGIGLMQANTPAEAPSEPKAIKHTTAARVSDEPAKSVEVIAQADQVTRNSASISDRAPVAPRPPQPKRRLRQLARVEGKPVRPSPPAPAGGFMVAKAGNPAPASEPIALYADRMELAESVRSSNSTDGGDGIAEKSSFGLSMAPAAPAVLATPDRALADSDTVAAGTSVSSLGRDINSHKVGDAMRWHYDPAGKPATRGVASRVAGESTNESVVDELNKTEGVHIAALFRYP